MGIKAETTFRGTSGGPLCRRNFCIEHVQTVISVSTIQEQNINKKFKFKAVHFSFTYEEILIFSLNLVKVDPNSHNIY